MSSIAHREQALADEGGNLTNSRTGKRNRLLIAALTVLNLPPLLSVFVWPFFTLMSVMMFDAPGSGDSNFTRAMFGVILAYPIPTITGTVMAYRSLKADKLARSLVATLIAYSGALAIFLMWLSLAFFCNDSFVCK